ncbi:MAG: ABC transporter permease [Candidatus Marinimicrobia bacterium]|nr:ABC transporter permease [Candidatus Neomarinimicrobiota bacterium]
MLRNYLKIALRNIQRHKGYSFINIFGLAIGLTCCLLILLWVQDELSYDKFHTQAANIYRVEQEQNYSGKLYHVNVTPYPCAPVWKEEIPEILNATRIAHIGSRALRFGDKSFVESNVQAVDPAFFTMFDYPLLNGDRQSVMDEKYSIVIDGETAEKYFGDENPIGKILIYDNQYNLTVTGVLKKVPGNSILQPKILIHMELTKELGEYVDRWGSNNILSFVLLQENAAISDVNNKITTVVNNHKENNSIIFMVNPLTRIHLFGFFGFDHNPVAIRFVYIFSVIAGFVLLIACINFMNLATARSANRAREIGMRKVVGAFRKNLIFQFIGESILLSLFAVLISVLLVVLLLPVFSTITGKEILWKALFNGQFIIGLLFITVITGFVSGIYPALFLSGFRPVTVLKGHHSSGRNPLLRRIMVIIQFSLSVTLIIGTLVIYKQLHYMRSKDLGFDQEYVIAISMQGDVKNSYPALKQELVPMSEIINVTASSHRPTNIGSNSGGIQWDGKDPKMGIVVGMAAVDFDFVEAMQIEILEGRAFSREYPNDVQENDVNVFMINETLAKIIGKDQIINEKIKFGVEGTVVGVMKDFNFKSIHNSIEPLVLYGYPKHFKHILIRLAPGDLTQSLAAVEKVWHHVLPNSPFDYQFLDEDFEWMYRTETSMSKLVKYFAILAIIIASLGLFGLASFTAEQRMKEIGIRKVLGASVQNLVLLMTGQFTKWVLIANLIAFPAAYIIMQKYLEQYAYRIDLPVSVFLAAGILALLVALLTVSYQAIKAAIMNPAKTLKYE